MSEAGEALPTPETERNGVKCRLVPGTTPLTLLLSERRSCPHPGRRNTLTKAPRDARTVATHALLAGTVVSTGPFRVTPKAADTPTRQLPTVSIPDAESYVTRYERRSRAGEATTG